MDLPLIEVKLVKKLKDFIGDLRKSNFIIIHPHAKFLQNRSELFEIIDIKTYRHTDKQTHRQTHRQTHTRQ